MALICRCRSGEASRTSQSRTMAVTASEACDREIAAPPCAPGHSDASQFHCGKHPPAADRAQPYQHGLPRRLRRAQKAKRLLDLSASVRVDLQPHRDLDDDGCLPLHCCIPRSNSCWWQKSCSVAAASQWRAGEPRDLGLAVGNRWRRWPPFPPRWYSRDPRLRRWRLRPKTPHPGS